MQLYRRADSTYWWVHYTVPGQPAVRRSTKRTNRKEAELVASHWYKEAHDAAQVGVRPQITLGEAVERYLKSLEGGPSHYNASLHLAKTIGAGHWKKQLFHLSPGMPMASLRTHHITELRDHRKASGRTNGTVNYEIKLLQRVYNLCRTEWGYAVDPGVQFKMLKVRPKTRYLSPEEVKEVLSRLDRPLPAYQKALSLALVLVDTGMRISEALSLRWSQIEMETKVIRVYRSKTRSWSTVPLTDRVAATLDQYKVQPQPFLSMAWAKVHLRRTIDEVCNGDETVVETAGKATIHSLRDTYASRLVQSGMGLFDVSKLLGHSSISQTTKYAHLDEAKVVAEARELLERL